MMHRHSGRASVPTAGSVNEGAMTAARAGRRLGNNANAFCRPGQRQHLVAGSAVPFGDRVLRPVHVVDARVARQIRQPRGQPLHQPFRRLSRARTLTAKSSTPGVTA